MRLAEIEAHIGSSRELLDIVGAMRSLASMRLQEAQSALPGIRRYTETIAEGIAAALLLAPELAVAAPQCRGRPGLLLCMSEHGFVAGFNERVLAAAADGSDELLMILGTRGAVQAEERGRRPRVALPMASRPEGVPDIVRRMAAEMFRAIIAREIDRVEIVYARYRAGGGIAIERQAVFPVDRTVFASKSARQPPLHNLPARLLLEKLIADYVSALLTEALIESLASENAARFAAMESAHDNVVKKLEQLRQQARQARQGEITEELLDVVTGAGALQPLANHRPARRPPPP